MRKPLLFAITLLAVLAVIFGLQRGRFSSSESPSQRTVEIENASGAKESKQSRTSSPDSLTDHSDMLEIEKRIGRTFTKEEKELKPLDKSWHEWGVFLDQHRMQSFMDGNVGFYGQVVTPQGEPIAGVSLIAEVDYYLNSIPKKLLNGSSLGKSEIEITTDDAGRFSIANVEGNKLTLRNFEREGFELPGRRRVWAYPFNPQVPDFHKADPENPEIFTMTRLE